MNQPEQEQLARRIAQHLEYGVGEIDTGTRGRLAAARKIALARYRGQPEPLFGLAWAGQALARVSEHRFYGARHLIAIALLVLALIGVAYRQTMMSGNGNDLADLEVALLTDELPINAYLDKGFDSWLKRSSR
ncbi:MAG: DUF3619 family protein [Betaproteobacteria bacterium]|nr:DUF3619 family protein [Betaproteobacteria bacterium]